MWRVTLPETALGHTLERLFEENPGLPGVVLLDGLGSYRSVLSRQNHMEMITRPYAPELQRKRPLSIFLGRGEPKGLCLPCSTGIDEAARHVLSRPADKVYEPFAVALDGGGFGLMVVHDLLLALMQRLEQANDSLESVVIRLNETQAELVQAEKMASLGTLVAGVAHEVSTPVGILIGASSFCRGLVNKLLRNSADGPFDRQEFGRALAGVSESMMLIERNATRAGELLHGFKKVAVDQSGGHRRTFELDAYIQEVLSTLGPQLSKRTIDLGVHCPSRITCDSFPGALSQVLINLVVNALTHAFAPDARGTIDVSAECAEDTVTITVADVGAVIPPALLPNIFDPFVTTRRGSGGSGLGLHIVYNLVVTILKGRIAATSDIGRGTRFVVAFPRIHPETTEERYDGSEFA